MALSAVFSIAPQLWNQTRCAKNGTVAQIEQLVRIAREFGRPMATAQQAREISKIGMFYKTTEESLLANGFAPNRNGANQGSCARPYDSSLTPFRMAFAMSTGTQITAACRLAMASWHALVLEHPPGRMARRLDEVKVRAQGLPARPFVDRQDLHASLGGGATAGGIGAAPARRM